MVEDVITEEHFKLWEDKITYSVSNLKGGGRTVVKDSFYQKQFDIYRNNFTMGYFHLLKTNGNQYTGGLLILFLSFSLYIYINT